MQDLYLKQLKVKNFCRYQEHTFNFLKPNGEPYKYICFFGPNGSGKSSVLDAISLLTMSQFGRSSDHILRSLKKYVWNPDYNPIYNNVQNKNDEDQHQMLIEGIYEMEEIEYVVQLSEHGWIRNDLFPADNNGPWEENYLRNRHRLTYFVTSDSDLSLSHFQIIKQQKENLEKIISEIVRYPVECIDPPNIEGWTTEEAKQYCTDLIIKKEDHNVHFKRMSVGERKIIKSFSNLFNLMHSLSYPGIDEKPLDRWPRLLLIDNIVMHVYYDRHVRMINCLKRVFDNQQLFVTTHSGTLIQRFRQKRNDHENELMINLEKI